MSWQNNFPRWEKCLSLFLNYKLRCTTKKKCSSLKILSCLIMLNCERYPKIISFKKLAGQSYIPLSLPELPYNREEAPLTAHSYAESSTISRSPRLLLSWTTSSPLEAPFPSSSSPERLQCRQLEVHINSRMRGQTDGTESRVTRT